MQGSPVPIHFEVVDVSPVEKRLNVEVAREHVTAKLEQAYRELGKKVNIRGFRPGKAPRDLLEKLYGKRVIYDVTQELLQDSMAYVAQKSPMRMTTGPVIENVSDVKRGQPMRYSARIEVLPAIEVKDWQGIEVTRRPAQVKDEDVEAVLQRKRAEQQEMVAIEGRTTATENDSLEIEITGELGPMRFDKDTITVDLWDKRGGAMPGLGPALVSVALDAKDQDVVVTVPEGIRFTRRGEEVPPEGELPRSATFRVTVKDSHERRLPELDDDFAKDTGEAETLDELRQQVREHLLKEDEESAKEEAREAMLDELARRNPVMIPPGFLQKVLEQNQEHYRNRLLIEGIQKGKDVRALGEEALSELVRAEAVRGLSREFLLMGLADQEKIEVTQADVEMRLAEIARNSDKSVARVRAEQQKDDPNLSSLHGTLRVEKALDLLESRAKIMEADKP